MLSHHFSPGSDEECSFTPFRPHYAEPGAVGRPCSGCCGEVFLNISTWKCAKVFSALAPLCCLLAVRMGLLSPYEFGQLVPWMAVAATSSVDWIDCFCKRIYAAVTCNLQGLSKVAFLVWDSPHGPHFTNSWNKEIYQGAY